MENMMSFCNLTSNVDSMKCFARTGKCFFKYPIFQIVQNSSENDFFNIFNRNYRCSKISALNLDKIGCDGIMEKYLYYFSIQSRKSDINDA